LGVDGCIHLVVSSSPANAPELLRVNRKGVLAVLLEQGQRLLVVVLPEPVGVAWNPDLREGNQLASSFASLIDEFDSFLNAGLKIEPAWLRGNLLMLC
jgi:hypothetical protein